MVILDKTQASLWNGKLQLSGMLIMTPKSLVFTFDDFSKSHMKLCIPFDQIQKMDTFLVFDLSKNGLRITGQKGHFDLFVIPELDSFLLALKRQLTLSTRRRG